MHMGLSNIIAFIIHTVKYMHEEVTHRTTNDVRSNLTAKWIKYNTIKTNLKHI